jgi:hypothetical protein
LSSLPEEEFEEQYRKRFEIESESFGQVHRFLDEEFDYRTKIGDVYEQHDDLYYFDGYCFRELELRSP